MTAEESAMGAGKMITIRQEVTYPDPPGCVGVAITDPHALAKWFEPNDHQPVVGHHFRFVVDDSAKDCEVLEAEPNRRLAWFWQYVPHPKTGKPQQTELMRINRTLAPDGDETKLILEHTGAENVRWLHRTLIRFE